MKKPYLKKGGKVAGFTIWIVDGKYIRGNIDKEFTNFGQHFRFRFIPENEFWIDKEHGDSNEEKYFIDHMLAENKFMSAGMTWRKANAKADMIEKRERNKSEALKTVDKKNCLEKIHKKLLKKYSNGIKVWIVNGMLVRDLYFTDFTEGGHDRVYSFVPEKEVWLDDDLSLNEMKFILLHELHERSLMCRGWKYNKAHKDSSEIEYYCRHHPKELDKKLEIEIKRNK